MFCDILGIANTAEYHTGGPGEGLVVVATVDIVSFRVVLTI